MSEELISWNAWKGALEIADRAVVQLRTGEPAADMVIESLEKRLNASADIVDSLREQLRVAREELHILRESKLRVHIDVNPMVTAPVCNCSYHRPGQSTGGWQCPVHGQQW